jgi:hypothetical protein
MKKIFMFCVLGLYFVEKILVEHKKRIIVLNGFSPIIVFRKRNLPLMSPTLVTCRANLLIQSQLRGLSDTNYKPFLHLHSKGYWQWCTNITIRITEFMDFVHRLDFWITVNHNFSKTGSVSIFRCGEEEAYSVGSLRKSWAQSLDSTQ